MIDGWLFRGRETRQLFFRSHNKNASRRRGLPLQHCFKAGRFYPFDESAKGSKLLASSLFRLMDRRVVDSNGGTKSLFRSAKRIGANDARHREHLVALARQLTSSASLKSTCVLSK